MKLSVSFESKTLFVLEQQGVMMLIHKADEEGIGQVMEWISIGLDEIVNLTGLPEARSTLPSDPEFLPRLAAYLTRQFNFEVVLE